MIQDENILQTALSKCAWIFQLFMGLMFIIIGILPFLVPQFFEGMMDRLGVTAMLPLIATIQFIGGLLLLIALPKQRLSGIASLWVSATMFGAIMAHLRVGDFLGMIPSIVILTLCLMLVHIHRRNFPMSILHS